MSHIDRKEGVVTIRPGVDIVASACPNLKKEFIELTSGDNKKLVIDLSGTEMIDSSGLGLLISARNSLTEAGGDEVEIINASADIRQLFMVMRLDNHFTLTE